MQVSHSRIETFKKCPFQYKLKYIEGLKTYFNNDPANPLVIGTALHTGIEKDTETAIKEYYANYPIISDQNIEEAIKLEYVIEKCKKILPEGLHEVKVECPEFVGYLDLLVPVKVKPETLTLDQKDEVCAGCYKYDECDKANCGALCKRVVETEWFDLYDFKYSNNVKNYLESGQLHEYKFYFEKINPTKRIRNMYFLFAPKVAIKMKYKNKTNTRDETVEEFRKRLKEELEKKEAQLVKVEYDSEKVIDFLRNAKECRMATKFDKTPSRLCDWCEFQKYCEEGDTLEIMNLPKNERRTVEANSYKKIWLYGQPFSGKTYLANKFPNVLMLNTDGNIKYVDAPFIPIKDIVTTSGRVTNRIFAWDVFKDAIAELEKKQNDFETIVVDLLEDTYEHCRLWCYEKLGIEHESDNSFKAWDYVKTEFLSTIKRLMNLDYNILLLSHEDTSKDLTKKSGDKVTAIKPNLQDKAALKIAGMVDIVGRLINDERKRTISFKTNEVVFGGGRLTLTVDEIPCDYDSLMEIYTITPESQENATEPKKEAKNRKIKEEPKKEEPQPEETKEKVVDPFEALKIDIPEDDEPVEAAPVEELPKRKPRTRTEPTEHEKKVEAFKEAHAKNEVETADATPVRRRRRVAE